jgi:intracellular multiplication protein IcmK
MKYTRLMVFFIFGLSSMATCVFSQAQSNEGNQTQATSELQKYGDTKIDRAAFSQVLQSNVPLKPSQIKILHKSLDDARRMAARKPGTMPLPTSKTVLVNLSPGTTPPVIRLQSGFISSLIFLDSTGQPWPIQAYDDGNPKAYNIQADLKSSPSTLLVQATGFYAPANLVVMLKGLSTPIVVTMLTGQKAVDYRVDLRVPGKGPNASVLYAGLPNQASPQLLDVLDGVAPAGAKRVQIEGGQAEAWLLRNHLYLRTSLTLLSPSWSSTMSSSDGTHAYALMSAPVLLASKQGRIVQLTVKGL